MALATAECLTAYLAGSYYALWLLMLNQIEAAACIKQMLGQDGTGREGTVHSMQKNWELYWQTVLDNINVDNSAHCIDIRIRNPGSKLKCQCKAAALHASHAMHLQMTSLHTIGRLTCQACA